MVGDLLRCTTPADTGGLLGEAKSLCPYGTADLLGEEAARVLRQAEKAAVERKVTISRSHAHKLCGLVAESCIKGGKISRRYKQVVRPKNPYHEVCSALTGESTIGVALTWP